jgi:hypothetical protein
MLGHYESMTIMPPNTLSVDNTAVRDRPVRIAVLLVQRDKAAAEAAVKVTGPVRTAVRTVFAHPKLTVALETLQMDADRLINRIVSRWEHPGYEEQTQQWEKSNGSMTVRWWIDRDDALSPAIKRA